jgi:hypothetical protein
MTILTEVIYDDSNQDDGRPTQSVLELKAPAEMLKLQ